MKILRVVLAISLFIVMTVFIGIRMSHANPPESQARVLSFEGQVQYRMPSSKEWKNVQKNELLSQGTEILTGPNSTCEIGVGEGIKSAVKLRQDSRATLTSLAPVKIDLRSGKIFSLVRNIKQGSTFQVSTPTAVATVRGTGWEQGLDSIQVFEESVHVAGSSGQESDIPEGKGIGIGDDGKLGDLFDVSNDARSEWKDFKEKVEEDLEAASNESTHEGFGGDTHEPDQAASHEDLGGEKPGALPDVHDIKTESTEEKTTDNNLSSSQTNNKRIGNN